MTHTSKITTSTSPVFRYRPT